MMGTVSYSYTKLEITTTLTPISEVTTVPSLLFIQIKVQF